MKFSESLQEFCAMARQEPVQISLRSLLDLAVPQEGADTRLLGRLKDLQMMIDLFALEVNPALDDGDLDDERLVSNKQPSGLRAEQVLAEISRDEDNTLEKKSTYTCCLRTLRKNENLSPNQYRKPSVEHSFLTAIAGLLNASGGVVLVGVEDNNKICGLSPDFYAMSLSDGNTDQWLLAIRSKIDSSFFEGRMINEHIQFDFFKLDEKFVARAVVRPRRKIALLKSSENNIYQIIQRQGNRSVQIEITYAEEFFENRYRARQH